MYARSPTYSKLAPQDPLPILYRRALERTSFRLQGVQEPPMRRAPGRKKSMEPSPPIMRTSNAQPAALPELDPSPSGTKAVDPRLLSLPVVNNLDTFLSARDTPKM